MDYFDDDILQIDMLKKFKFFTPYVTGNCDEYDIACSEFEISEIQKIFNVTEEQLRNAYDNEPGVAIRELSKLFNIPLDIQVLDITNSRITDIEEVSFYL